MMRALMARFRAMLTCEGCGIQVSTGGMGVPRTWTCTICGHWNTVR